MLVLKNINFMLLRKQKKKYLLKDDVKYKNLKSLESVLQNTRKIKLEF